jgi:hypothetical protein
MTLAFKRIKAVFFIVFFFFKDRVSLYSPLNPAASVSQHRDCRCVPPHPARKVAIEIILFPVFGGTGV